MELTSGVSQRITFTFIHLADAFLTALFVPLCDFFGSVSH